MKKYKITFSENCSSDYQLVIKTLLQDSSRINIVNTYPVIPIGFLIVSTYPGMGYHILKILSENGYFDLKEIKEI